MWALLQPARITNKVKRAMNRVLGGVLDNGPNIDPFTTSKEVWVTEGIFFNGVVPWEILIMFFFLNLTTISQIFIKIAVLGYKHFMLENRNISINMGTEALVAG